MTARVAISSIAWAVWLRLANQLPPLSFSHAPIPCLEAIGAADGIAATCDFQDLAALAENHMTAGRAIDVEFWIVWMTGNEPDTGLTGLVLQFL